jgi:bla regulator protein blaR1
MSWVACPLPRDPGAPPLPPIDPNAPSLFVALQEQLGLKLESAKGPIELLVVDSVERPTPD